MDLAKSAPLLSTYWPFAVAVSAVVVGHKIWKYLQDRETGPPDVRRKKSVSFSEKIETLPQNSKYANIQEEEDQDNFFLHNEDFPHIPYKPLTYTDDVMIQRSHDLYKCLNNRRSCRFFSDKPVPIEVIQNIIRSAGKCMALYSNLSIFLFLFFFPLLHKARLPHPRLCMGVATVLVYNNNNSLFPEANCSLERYFYVFSFFAVCSNIYTLKKKCFRAPFLVLQIVTNRGLYWVPGRTMIGILGSVFLSWSFQVLFGPSKY